MMRPIDCRTFEFWCEDLQDASLDVDFRNSLANHRDNCATCSDFALRSNHQRRSLHGLPNRAVPQQLAVNLRVLASKDRARRATYRNWSSRMASWQERTRVWMQNLGKPLALPMAGGLASAFFLFCVLMPTFALPAHSSADVPTAWYQTAQLSDLGPFGLHADELVLDVRINSSGRVVDYSIPPTEVALLKDLELRRAVENSLIFMQFRPANFFGQPTMETIRITIRRSQIEVKG